MTEFNCWIKQGKEGLGYLKIFQLVLRPVLPVRSHQISVTKPLFNIMHRNSVDSLELVAINILDWISHDPRKLPVTKIPRTLYIYNFTSISTIVSKGIYIFIRIEVSHFTTPMKILAIGGYNILDPPQLASGTTLNHVK